MSGQCRLTSVLNRMAKFSKNWWFCWYFRSGTAHSYINMNYRQIIALNCSNSCLCLVETMGFLCGASDLSVPNLFTILKHFQESLLFKPYLLKSILRSYYKPLYMQQEFNFEFYYTILPAYFFSSLIWRLSITSEWNTTTCRLPLTQLHDQAGLRTLCGGVLPIIASVISTNQACCSAQCFYIFTLVS